ncbi:MAG: alpha/beta hydrolase [Candidatus Tumulicola sp.]
MQRTIRATLCAVVFMLTYPAVANAAVPPPLPAPAASFDVGSLHVDRYGNGAQALVFIPGLTCGPWEWSGQILHFATRYTVYALTLPGFDGRPPIDGPLFATTTADFWTLLDKQHIVKPVVIGHSLGGTMGFMLATQHPDRLRAVIALDGLPIYPGNVMLSPAQVKATAAGVADAMAKQTPAQFEQSERTKTLPYLVTSQSDIDAIGPLSGKSDPAASGRWFQEDLLLDLRPDLAKATVPILLIAPFDASFDPRFGATSSADKQAFYGQLVKGAPNVRIVSIEHSRHFAMYDQPQATTNAIAAFLSSLPPT